MTQALYRKWRPRRWDEVVGQEAVIRTLRQAVRSGRVAHAYLFSGPRGTGKTTTARLLAKALNCLHPDPEQRPCDQCQVCQAVNQGRFLDLIEIDAASHTGVDDVRALRDKIHYAPGQGRYKVYIIDEVHMLSTAAFNALLKTLEEPPAHAIFVLATTEVHRVPATVRSRCQHYPFRRIPVADIVAYLRRIVEAEGIAIEDAALTYIARQARGGLRDAISLLDQLASLGEPITLGLVHGLLGTAPTDAVTALVDAWLDRDPGRALQHLRAGLDQGIDARQLTRQLADYVQQLLRLRLAGPDLVEAAPETLAVMQAQAARLEPRAAMRWLELLQRALAEARGVTDPALWLELAVVDATLPAEGAPHEASSTADAAPSRTAPSSRPAAADAAPARGGSSAKPAAAGDAAPAPGLDAARLRRVWPQVVARARRDSPAEAPDLGHVLQQVRLVGVRAGQVVLQAPSRLVQERLNRPAYRQALDALWQAVLGQPVPWRVEARGSTAASAVPSPEAHPLLQALRELGGQVSPLNPSDEE